MLKCLLIATFLILVCNMSAQNKVVNEVDHFINELSINSTLSLRFSDIGEPNNYYTKTLTDFAHTMSSPLGWKGKDYIKFGAILAGGITLYVLDEQIYYFVHRSRNAHTEFLSKFIFEPIGHNTTFALLAGMAGYGLLSGKDRPTTTALLAFESLMITGVVTLIPKMLAGRVRPHHTDPVSPDVWRGPLQGRSFWSGHTAAAFTVATVMAEMYNDHNVIPALAYMAATFTGLSRIHDKKHWASDVFFGAVCGTAIGHLVVRSYRSNLISMTPLITPETQGVFVRLKF